MNSVSISYLYFLLCREDILDEILDLVRTDLVAIAPTVALRHPKTLQEKYNNLKAKKNLSKLIGKYQKQKQMYLIPVEKYKVILTVFPKFWHYVNNNN